MVPGEPGVLEALDRIATRAVAGHWSRSGRPGDRFAAAWSAAAEALCTPGAKPSEHDLYRAAEDAITLHIASERRFHAWSQASGYTQIHAAAETYWWQPPLTGWEDAVVERVAARQIWAALSPAHRRVLRALITADGDYVAAARLLGTSYATFRTRLGRARAAFRVLWHEGESPSRQWSKDRRVFRAGDDPDAKVTDVPVTRQRRVSRRRRVLAVERGERAA